MTNKSKKSKTLLLDAQDALLMSTLFSNSQTQGENAYATFVALALIPLKYI
jgi:hypothetical protein